MTKPAIKVVCEASNGGKCPYCGAEHPDGPRLQTSYFSASPHLRLRYDDGRLTISDSDGPLYYRSNVREIAACEVEQ